MKISSICLPFIISAYAVIALARADDLSSYICSGEVLQYDSHSFSGSIERVDHLLIDVVSVDGGKKAIKGLSIPSMAIAEDEVAATGWSQLFHLPESQDLLRVVLDSTGQVTMSSVTRDGITRATTRLSCRVRPMKF